MSSLTSCSGRYRATPSVLIHSHLHFPVSSARRFPNGSTRPAEGTQNSHILLGETSSAGAELPHFCPTTPLVAPQQGGFPRDSPGVERRADERLLRRPLLWQEYFMHRLKDTPLHVGGKSRTSDASRGPSMRRPVKVFHSSVEQAAWLPGPVGVAVEGTIRDILFLPAGDAVHDRMVAQAAAGWSARHRRQGRPPEQRCVPDGVNVLEAVKVSQEWLLPPWDCERLGFGIWCSFVTQQRPTAPSPTEAARSILRGRSGFYHATHSRGCLSLPRARAGAVDLQAALPPDLAHLVAEDMVGSSARRTQFTQHWPSSVGNAQEIGAMKARHVRVA